MSKIELIQTVHLLHHTTLTTLEQVVLAIDTVHLELIPLTQTVHVLVHVLSTITLTTLSISYNINAWQVALKTLSSTHQTTNASTPLHALLDTTATPLITSALTTVQETTQYRCSQIRILT